jgi:tRNA U34 5-carboxymethylaminomethyl modifying GTPase MnmE/TrmE
LGGLQKHWVLEVGEKIRKLTAFSELGIDFSDQEIDSLALKKLKAEAQEIRNQIQEIANSFDRGQKIQDGIALAIVGLPNAGKSSFKSKTNPVRFCTVGLYRWYGESGLPRPIRPRTGLMP